MVVAKTAEDKKIEERLLKLNKKIKKNAFK